MIIGSENLISFIRLNDAPYWKIYLGSSKGPLFAESGLQPELGVEDSIIRLKKVFAALAYGMYYIKLKQKEDQTKNTYETAFEITSNDSKGVAGIGGFAQPVGVSQDEIALKIKEALDAYKTQDKLEKLEQENKDLKALITKPSDLENAFVKIANAAGPQIGQAIQSFMSPKAAAAVIAGLPEKKLANPEQQKDYEIKLEKALEDLAKVDPDLDQSLMDLATFAKANPEKYKSFLPMLKIM